jgi:chromosomal replication initiation ATPase DnaA
LPTQLTLPLPLEPAQGREDFIVSAANAEAVALIDAYPDWPSGIVALYGPSGSGKTHLARAWSGRANAPILKASALDEVSAARLPTGALVIEDVDVAPPLARDASLFAIMERGGPLLLTGHDPPSRWSVSLPDLASRFAAVLAFPLWLPDDELLAALARKLFTDRQLKVPDAVISRMLESIERSPSAIRDFVARLDARALGEKRKISLGLLRELLPTGR